MNITSFTNQIVQLLQKELGDTYQISLRKVTKNNGVTLTGIVAKREDFNSFPTIYIDDYYDQDAGEEELLSITRNMADRLRQADVNQTLDINEFIDFSRAKHKISFKLINTDMNRKLLKDIPSRPFFNLSIVYYYLLEKDSFEGNASILIRNSHMDTWEVNEEEIYEAAYYNAPRLLPPMLQSMDELLDGAFPGESFEDLIPMYVLTNREKLFGASCILYPDALKKFAQSVNSDLYVLPSSIHETILLPQNSELNPEAFLDIVTEINHSQVEEEEVLADSVYFYNKKEDALYLLDNH